MELPFKLQKRIVDFLISLPNIHDNNTQRALIYSAGLDSRLKNQINFDGPPIQFFQLLVSTLDSYGQLEDGRYALEAVLQTAKHYVGQDKKKCCDALLQEFRSIVEKQKVDIEHITKSYQQLQHPTQLQIENLKRQIERLQKSLWQAKQYRQKSRRKSFGLKPNVERLFVDRIAYLDKLAEHITDQGIRLILIVGQAGIGKTTLAAKFCDNIEKNEYQIQSSHNVTFSIHSIVYVNQKEMLSLTIQDIFDKLLQTLDEELLVRIEPTIKEPKISVIHKTNLLLECLKKNTLLILDNFETLLDGINVSDPDLLDFIETVCETQNGVKIIITSRKNVDIDTFAMKTISLNKGLDEDYSIEFLRKLANIGLPITKIINATDEELKRLSKRVHGVPMALRSLASFLKKRKRLGIKELLEDDTQYEDFISYDITKGLRKLIREQYEDLPNEAKIALQVLAVYNAPVKAVAVQYILPALETEKVLDVLTDDYFLIQEHQGNYELHPTVQEHAYKQIPDKDSFPISQNNLTKTVLHSQAADFFAQIKSPQSEWKTIIDLQPHLDEFEHRVKAMQYDQAASLLNTIDSDYLFLWGHYKRLTELRQMLIGHLVNPDLIVANLSGLGRVWQIMGRVRQSIEFYSEALAITRKSKDYWEESVQLGFLANAYHDLGEFEKALKFHKQALSIARKICNRRVEGTELGGIGLVYFTFRRFDRAIEFFEQAITIFQELGDGRNEIIWMGNMGRIYYNLLQIEPAINCFQKALFIARKIGDHHGESFWCDRLGLTYQALGQIASAIELHEQALEIATEINDRRAEGASLCNLAMAYHAHGQFEKALKFYEQALSIAREIGDCRGETIRLGRMGATYFSLKQFEQATKNYKQALVIARSLNDQREESFHLLGLGKILLYRGLLQEANQCCKRALSLNMPQSFYEVTLGIVLLQQHDPAAKETFDTAIARCRDLLDKSARLYKVRYALAAGLLGSTVCDPQWIESCERARLLVPIIKEYRQALEICSSPGVIQFALRDLEMFHIAGIEGLEPIFELLSFASEDLGNLGIV